MSIPASIQASSCIGTPAAAAALHPPLSAHDNESSTKPSFIAIMAFMLLTASHGAWAARSLNSDDAGTTDAGSGQLESWVERTDSDRWLILAPACGIAAGMELGADYTLPGSREVLRAAGGLASKWVPQVWRVDTQAGELSIGVKLGAAFERPAAGSWRAAGTGALKSATLAASDNRTWHANLGATRDRGSSTTAALLNLALVWTPRDVALMFAGSQTNNRRDGFGGTVNTVGAHGWPLKGSFGVDLTTGRESGAGSGTIWTLGFGGYGLGF